MPPSAPTTAQSKWEIILQYAKDHPMLSGTILGFALFLASTLLGLLVVGTFCSSLDDSKFPPRIAALVRLGKRVGIVFKGSGPDFAVAIFGEEAVSDSQEEKARKRLKSLSGISEE